MPMGSLFGCVLLKVFNDLDKDKENVLKRLE